MIAFLTLFIFLSFIATVFKFSMIEEKKHLLYCIIGVFLFSIATYQFAIQLNSDTFLEVMNNKQIISMVSVVQIIDSILMIILCIILIGDHYKKSTKLFVQIFSIIPSIVLLGGMFLLQVYAFILAPNVAFELIAISFASVTAACMFLSVIITKFIISSWEIRAEIKILLAFIQILLAMFLPIILNEVNVPFSNLTIDIPSIITLTITVTLFSIVGFIIHKFNLKLKIW